MVTSGIRTSALLFVTIAMVSCAAQKATPVAEIPVEKKVEPPPEPLIEDPQQAGIPDDEIRIPAMLNFPKESDFRPSNPLLPKLGPGSGSVVVRPPTDPPSRVKPDTNPAD
jgi:hypothetical protein